MALSIHPEAKQHFDALAAEALALVTTAPPPRRSPSPPEAPEAADERDIRRVSARDIVPDSLEVVSVDATGARTELRFSVSGKPYVLAGEGMKRLEQLLARLHRQRKLYTAVGPKLLSRCLTDWLKARLGGDAIPEFSNFLLQKAAATIQERTIVIPLEHCRSESAFDFAGVRFDDHAITRTMMDTVEGEWTSAKPEQVTEIQSAMRRYRRWFQGQTCGVVSILADPSWAAESATEIVDRALSALRLFSPSGFLPDRKCVVGRVGSVLLPAAVTCELMDQRPSLISDEVAAEYRDVEWYLSDENREEAMRAGLTDLERLLLTDRPSELEEAVLRAVELLDESVTCNAHHKRAALALTAAESLFLLNDTESIQVMLGLRCGRLIGRTVEDRIEIDRTIKRAYDLRSAYLHHGRTESDPEVLSKLHAILIDAFVAVARLGNTVRSKADLFEHLQNLIWS